MTNPEKKKQRLDSAPSFLIHFQEP